ncbi:ubiquitin-conjugating enzyme E2 [Streptomyces xanthophaeus]
MTMNTKRLHKEHDELARDNEQVSAVLCSCPEGCAQFSHWVGKVDGPAGSPYQGGVFAIDIRVPKQYPFMPPNVHFQTRVWHPNVSSQTGAINLGILNDQWSPAFTFRTTLLSLQELLAKPDPDDPQDHEVATMAKHDMKRFEAKAREWTSLYAQP